MAESRGFTLESCKFYKNSTNLNCVLIFIVHSITWNKFSSFNRATSVHVQKKTKKKKPNILFGHDAYYHMMHWLHTVLLYYYVTRLQLSIYIYIYIIKII